MFLNLAAFDRCGEEYILLLKYALLFLVSIVIRGGGDNSPRIYTPVMSKSCIPVAEFKGFELRFKFKPRFKYGWFHLKLYQMSQDLRRRFI